MGQISNNLYHLSKNISESQASVRIPQVKSTNDCLQRVNSLSCNLTSSYLSSFGRAKRFLIESEDSDEIDVTRTPVHDIAQAILQHSSNFEWDKTLPLQQLSCDMWNTFVTSSGYCPTGSMDSCRPPIVKWGEHDTNYARHKHKAKSSNSFPVSVISFSTRLLNDGILAWPILMHETAHTILEAGSKLSP